MVNPNHELRRARIEHFMSDVAKRSLTDQLDVYLSTPDRLHQQWLHSPDMRVHVRRNVVPFGRPKSIPYSKNLTDAVCLNIVDVQFTSDTPSIDDQNTFGRQRLANQLTWSTFINGAIELARGHNLGLIYVENVTDKRLLQWFDTQIEMANAGDLRIWQRTDWYPSGEKHRQPNFFRWIPLLM